MRWSLCWVTCSFYRWCGALRSVRLGRSACTCGYSGDYANGTVAADNTSTGKQVYSVVIGMRRRYACCVAAGRPRYAAWQLQVLCACGSLWNAAVHHTMISCVASTSISHWCLDSAKTCMLSPR